MLMVFSGGLRGAGFTRPPLVVNFLGLLLVRLRYFDAEAKRPGLPPDVAALVEKLEDRRAVVRKVRAVVRANLDPLYAQGMQYGMIGW